MDEMVDACKETRSRRPLAVSLQKVPLLWRYKSLEARQKMRGMGCSQQGQHPLNQGSCIPGLLVLPQQNLHLPASSPMDLWLLDWIT